jgi:outer membrane lipoprotein LolB
MNGKQLTPILMAIALSACQTTHQTLLQSGTAPSASPKAIAAETPRQSIQSFELSGAMAARSQQKAWTASVNWLQSGPSQYDIRLMGPLGNGAIRIQKSGGQVTYQEGKKIIASNNPENLFQQQTGVRLPVNQLFYWVRGVPAPGAVQGTKKDTNSHITQLQQGCYVVDYMRYSVIDNTAMPSVIHLRGHGLMVKLIIKHWKLF